MKLSQKIVGMYLVTAAAAAIAINARPAHANAPSLQIAPLQYEATLSAGRVSGGVVDVSNPTDSVVTISSNVRGFRQTGTNGDLEFFDDPDLTAAIQPGLKTFTLGPREAVRVTFTIDARKLPVGGTYAAIFFQTNPPDQTSGSSYISQSANVGTLLLLTNGSGTKNIGKISRLQVPFLQVGEGLRGKIFVTNSDASAHPVGFKPKLQLQPYPWSKSQSVASGLVLAQATRQFAFTRPGAYVGLVPVTVKDAVTGTQATSWVLACTGWARVAIPAIAIIVTISAIILHKKVIQRRRKRLL